MKRLLRFSVMSLMALMCSTAFGQTTKDILTAEGFGLDKGTQYKEYTGKKATSDAEYYLNCATGSEGIFFQIRTNGSNSGIVTTKSGGTLKSITIVFNETTVDQRVVDIYGNTNAYTNAADLYATGSNSNQGTKIGALAKANGLKQTLNVEGNYPFFGLRSNQGALYIDTIIVEWAGSVQAQLTISGTTPFTTSTTVTITPSSTDNDVYYTTDGSDPKNSTLLYTAPFTITETTTVKAYEEGANLTAEKTFTKQDVTVQEVANIAAFKALEKDVEAKLKLNNAQVLYANGNDIYVKDASGAIDFYSTGLTLTTGQKLNGSVIGKKAVYGKIPELTKTENTNANDITITAGTATAQTVTIANAKSDALVCDLIKVENVKITTKTVGTRTDTYAYIGTDSIQVYDKWKLVSGTPDANTNYTVEGILIPFNDIYEIYPTVNYLNESGGGSTTQQAANIQATKALAENTIVEVQLNNAQVVYVNGNNYYVRDASGAIDFYNTGLNLQQDQILNGKVILKYAPYRNLPELVKCDQTNADNLTITSGTAAQPKVIANATDVQTNLCDLVQLNGAQFFDDNGTVKVGTTDNSVIPYNTFKIAEINDFNTYVDSNSYTVVGIAYIFNTTLQIAPITITNTTGINGISTEQDNVNTPAYNLAGQRVNDNYKGVVIKNGKKYLNK